MKTCCKCKEEKLFNEFSICKSQKDGYQNTCRVCRKEYYLINKQRISAKGKEYRELNKDSLVEYDKERYKANRDTRLVKVKEYYEVNKDKISLRVKEYRDANKENLEEYHREYYKYNKDKFAKYGAKRRAMKLKATPIWLTEEQHKQIEEFYKKAQDMKLLTGEEHHVDHIIPLQGKTVCGLHVPWNLQVITAKENRSKRNTLLED